MKKFLFSFMMIAFLLPVSNALAYSGGLLEGKMMNYGADLNGTQTTNALTDGNLDVSSYFQFGVNGSLKDTLYYHFSSPVDLDAYYISASSSMFYNYVKINLYDEQKNIVKSDIKVPTHGVTRFESTYKNVSYVALISSDTGGRFLRAYEFDVYSPKEPIVNLTETHTYNSIELNWTNPNMSGFSSTIIKKNGVQIADLDANIKSYILTGLTPDANYNFELSAKYSDGLLSTPAFINVKTDSITIPEDVTNLDVNASYNKIGLSWTLPVIDNFKQVNIYKDGKKIAYTTKSTYIDSLVSEKTSYKYVIKVESTDNVESPGVTINATTPEAKASGEVSDLAADAKYDRVNLSWTNPTDSYFKSIKIYRNGILIATTTSNTYTDNSVADKTAYQYKISTVSTENVETLGVKIDTTTPVSPVTVIEGGGYVIGETGDYTYTWTSPTEGKVKVMVGGQLYATVDASDLKITILKSEMKYKALGDPDVILIPVTADGIEGKPTQPIGENNTVSNTKLPFGANDTLNASVMLLIVVGPFVLLTLAFLVVPSLRKIIVDAFNGVNADGKRRRTKDEVVQRVQVMREERMKIDRTERDRTARKRTIGRRVM